MDLVERLARRERCAPALEHVGQLQRMVYGLPAPALDLLWRRAGVLVPALVEPGDGAVGLCDPRELRDRVGELVEPRLALLQLEVGALPLGHVDGGAQHANGLAAFAYDDGAREEPDDAAVRPHSAELELVRSALLEAPPDRLGHEPLVLGMDERREARDRRREVLGSDAVDPVEGVGPDDAIGGQVPVPDADLGHLRGELQPLFAAAERVRRGRGTSRSRLARDGIDAAILNETSRHGDSPPLRRQTNCQIDRGFATAGADRNALSGPVASVGPNRGRSVPRGTPRQAVAGRSAPRRYAATSRSRSAISARISSPRSPSDTRLGAGYCWTAVTVGMMSTPSRTAASTDSK
jgi:hypothetical protein